MKASQATISTAWSPPVGYSSSTVALRSEASSGECKVQSPPSSWGLGTRENSIAHKTTSNSTSRVYTTRYSGSFGGYGGGYGGGYDEEYEEDERREREFATIGYIIASGNSRDKDRSKLSKLDVGKFPEP